MIVIVHFGAQYAQLIRRAVNELGVRAEVVRPESVSVRAPADTTGVILSGGPASVSPEIIACVELVIGWKLPVLGICLGHQALVAARGGQVAQQVAREYGRATLTLTAESRIRHGLPLRSSVWMSHGDTVVALPPPGPNSHWTVWGTTESGAHAGIASELEELFGVQFHPEVTQTQYGMRIFENFLFEICHARKDYAPGNLAAQLIATVQEHVGENGHVLVATSLGVDSTTTAALCREALGPDRVHCVFVNNGLQRDEDLELAQRAHTFLSNLVIVDATEEFLRHVEGLADPEAKRRMIGETFWGVFGKHARGLQQSLPITVYVQGTLAPDVIESGRESGQANVIKTHHNLVLPPPDFPFPPFEPLRTLYKDQVRALGRSLGVPDEILRRHPFPGPGLAVRVKAPVTRDRLRIARACDTIFIQALKESGRYDAIDQASVIVGNDTAVCVRGDARATGVVVNCRAVVTRDFMTADVPEFPPSFLPDVAGKIINSVDGVGRVTFDVTRKPPATIEWE